MKTNRSARWIIRIRFAVLCLAIAALALVEFGVGGSLASRIGQTTAIRSECPQAPNLCISDLMEAAR